MGKGLGKLIALGSKWDVTHAADVPK